MPCRIDQHHTVLIEQPFVTLNRDAQIGLVPERQPGAAIRQRIGVHAGSGIQCRAHARSGFAIPTALAAGNVYPGRFPQAQLGRMRTAFVAARSKRRPG